MLKAAFKGLRDRAIIAVLLGCVLRRSAVAALTDGRSSGGLAPEATGGAARGCAGAVGVALAISDRASFRLAGSRHGGAWQITDAGAFRTSAIRTLAVAATHNALLAPERAAGIAPVNSAKSIGVRSGEWPTLRQAQALPNVPDIVTTKPPRDRAILAMLLGCVRPPARVAAFADGRSSGGFTPEATGAARHTNTPELPCGDGGSAPAMSGRASRRALRFSARRRVWWCRPPERVKLGR